MWETLIPMGMNLASGLLQNQQQGKLTSQQNRLNSLTSILSPPRPVPQVRPPMPRLSVPNYSKPVSPQFASAQRSLTNVSKRDAGGTDNTMLIVGGIAAVAAIYFLSKKK